MRARGAALLLLSLLLSAVDGAPASATRHTGVTHVHKTGDNARTYYMHYILLAKLNSRARYSYQVQSGARNASLSDRFSFRAPYAGSTASTVSKMASLHKFAATVAV